MATVAVFLAFAAHAAGLGVSMLAVQAWAIERYEAVPRKRHTLEAFAFLALTVSLVIDVFVIIEAVRWVRSGL